MREKGVWVQYSLTGQGLYTSGEGSKVPQGHIFCPHRITFAAVFVDVFIPMYLKAIGWLTGMILASETDRKAAVLLGDLQAELMENKRFAADFGEQRTIGSWSEGEFVTTDGIGFWSFGLGQNPAGVRRAAVPPLLFCPSVTGVLLPGYPAITPFARDAFDATGSADNTSPARAAQDRCAYSWLSYNFGIDTYCMPDG